MGQDPEVIRRDIERTRENMGETVDAIGYKADVPSRAKENVQGKVDSVKESILGAKDSVAESTPSKGEAKQQAKKAAGIAQENPLGLAIGAAAVGFVVGLAIPSTRVEDEKLGPVADEVKDRVKETASEAVDRGKQVAQETAQSATQAAKETAQQSGQEHAQELKGTAQEQADQARQQVAG